MYTIFGGCGFIGGNIVKKLKEKNVEFFIPSKNDKSIFSENLGKVIYCAGLSSDFRERPFDTVEAHVSYLSEVLRYTYFDSFVYVSSARVYLNSTHGNEDLPLTVNSNTPEDIFNISKLMGESLCLNCGKGNIKMARISNVLGNDFNSNNFIYSITKDAVEKNEVILNTTLDSEKDYIGIDDVVNILLKLADSDISGIYNIAAGQNTTHEAIINILKEATHCDVKISEKAIPIKFPIIEIDKIKKELDFVPLDSKLLIKNIISNYISKKR
jgi:nucleoside-diphosphate-sugar epimerase